MMKAPVNKIIPFSNVDGPGNRCAIFFQGCPFTCLYCHNPETIHMCKHCGKCVSTCPTDALSIKDDKVEWNVSTCVHCDTCIQVCEHMASPKIQWMQVEDIIKILKKNRIFLRGITVSGGECMMHASFLLELFKEAKALGLTCLIDSNGFYDFSQYAKLMEVCDGVMLDVKAVNEKFHKELTGKSNVMVLKNLQYLLSINKLEEVRTVILPNKDMQNKETVSYVSKLLKNKSRYKLIRYRKYGVREEGLEKLGAENISLAYIEQYKQMCEENGNHTSVII